MSSTPERRLRRTDLWIPAVLFLGFLGASAVELMVERNTRTKTLAEMRRLQHVIVGQAYKPLDVDFLQMLQTQDTQINQLLEITRQQTIIARGIKNLQDKRGKRISAVEAEVKKLRAEQKQISLPASSSQKAIRKRVGGKP